jgi:hypothetical protein
MRSACVNRPAVAGEFRYTACFRDSYRIRNSPRYWDIFQRVEPGNTGRQLAQAADAFTAHPYLHIFRLQFAQFVYMRAYALLLEGATEGNTDGIGVELLCSPADLLLRNLTGAVFQGRCVHALRCARGRESRNDASRHGVCHLLSRYLARWIRLKKLEYQLDKRF